MSYKTKPLAPGVPDKITRVRHLMELMSGGKYYGHKTCFELEARWGVSWQTVKQDASEAGRLLKLTPEEIVAAKVHMAEWFIATANEAKSMLNNVTGLPDFKSAMEAMTKYGIYSGIADKVAAEAEANSDRSPIEVTVKYAEAEAKGSTKKDK